MEQQRRLFGDFELPRRVGTVENVGLQLPTVSPDGRQILCLRADGGSPAQMSLFGAVAGADASDQAVTSVWLRQLEGAAPGKCISKNRWAHSPVWSDSGRALAYVVNEPSGSHIVHLDSQTGQENILGVPDGVNCLPRFDGDDRTLLFCAGPSADGPLRVYRQTAGEGDPQALTPEGMDCLLPVAVDADGRLLCGRVEGDALNWIRFAAGHVEELAHNAGPGQRPYVLQAWAGVPVPPSADRRSFIFYDGGRDRIGICHTAESTVRMHRQGGIAATWLDDHTIALATSEGLFAVNTGTGASVSLLSGAWIPARFVPSDHRLLLFGKADSRSRLSIYEILFKPDKGAS
jgi:hypothetical protein